MLRMLIHNWWLFACRAVLALTFAAYLWFIEGAKLPPLMHVFANASIVILFGVLAFGAALLTFAAILRPSNRGHQRGLLFLDGIGSCVTALVVVLTPSLALNHLIMIIAVWAIFAGFCQLLLAFDIVRHLREEWLLLAAGLGSVGFGIILLQKWTMREQDLVSSLTWYSFFSAAVMGGIGFGLWSAGRRRPANTICIKEESL